VLGQDFGAFQQRSNPSNARAYQNANPGPVAVVDAQLGGLYRLLGRGQGELAVAIQAPGLFPAKERNGVETLDLRCEPALQFAGIEERDGPDTRPALGRIGPSGWYIVAERGYAPKTGDHDAGSHWASDLSMFAAVTGEEGSAMDGLPNLQVGMLDDLDAICQV
jgi:hypothetical protein